MTADPATISLDAIDAALAAAVPGLGEDEQRLAVAGLASEQLTAAVDPSGTPDAYFLLDAGRARHLSELGAGEHDERPARPPAFRHGPGR